MHQVIGSLYRATDTVITKVGALLDYQFYVHKLGQDNRENYYNFSYNGPQASEAERRQFTVPSKAFTITDTSLSVVSARRQPVFPNTRLLAHRVHVTYTVDMRAAYYNLLGRRYAQRHPGWPERSPDPERLRLQMGRLDQRSRRQPVGHVGSSARAGYRPQDVG